MLSLLTPLLATTRLTALITQDEITQPIRDKVEAFATQNPNSPLHTLKLDYLVSCSRCVSIYAAGTTLALYAFRPTRPLVKLLALSQAAILALQALEALENHNAPQLDLALDGDDPNV